MREAATYYRTGLLIVTLVAGASGQNKPRARDLGIPFEGATGSVTDSKAAPARPNGMPPSRNWHLHRVLDGKPWRAETMTGVDGQKVFALPHDRFRGILKKYNRLP